MSMPRTTMKEILEISPYLFEYQQNQQQVKDYVLKLIDDGLEASEILHQVQIWMANKRTLPEPTSVKKIEYVGQFSVRTNAASTISMKDTLKLPPYRRIEKIKKNQPVALQVETAPESVPTSEIREWLSSLDEKDRAEFYKWCTLQGKIVSKALWEEFSLTHSDSPYPFEQVPTFDRRSYVHDGYSLNKVRKAQGKFRHDVLKNWDGKCAITSTRFAIDACHILSHASGGAPSVENGIALATDLHRLLDSGHLRIEGKRAVFSDEARNDIRYKSYHGQELNEPLFPVNLG